MEVFNIYFQQLEYDGADYVRGRFLNPQSELGVYCRSILLSPFQDMKELATLDWPGEDGLDVYIPGEIQGSGKPRRKAYDMEVSLLWEGDDSEWSAVRKELTDFMSKGRMCFYDEMVGVGRKDLTLKKFDTDILYRNSTDGITIFGAKLVLTVHDPKTDVVCEKDGTNKVIGLRWQN